MVFLPLCPRYRSSSISLVMGIGIPRGVDILTQKTEGTFWGQFTRALNKNAVG